MARIVNNPKGYPPNLTKLYRGKAFWRKLEREYIHGIGGDDLHEPTWPTLDDLSKRHEVTVAAIARYSGKGAWTSKRDENREYIRLQIRCRAMEQKAEQMEKSSDTDVSIARILKNEILQVLKEIQDNRAQGKTLPPRRMAMMLVSLGKAEESAQKITRLAYEQPTTFVEERRKVEAELTVRQTGTADVLDDDPVYELIRKAALQGGDALMAAIEAVDRAAQARPPIEDAEIVRHALPAHEAPAE